MRLFLCLCLYACLVGANPLSSRNGTVQTANGPIVGHRASNSSRVWEYLGIPYAEPPVGARRFAAPQKYTTKQKLVASKFSAGCPVNPSKPVRYPNATAQEPRIVANFATQNGHEQSEDCLTLNVWSKATKRSKKPVLVFFYGGRWSIGETNTPFYNGKYFADAEDVVVVTLNYRLNIFGFSGAPGESQNVGLLDQRLAVEWVHHNVGAFGGDRDKIVIFGQSSGSVAVDYWSYAWRKNPLVSGLISHSGNVFSFPINSRELAEQHWYNASSLLGCGSSGDVMPCMREKSLDEIKAAAAKVKPPPNTSVARSQPVFQPTPDGHTVFDDYETRSSRGKFARLPYLAGNNHNEAGYYKIAAFAQGNILTDKEWDDFNLADFTCPTAREAANRAKFRVPTWRFRYFGDWENLRLYPTSGAYHGSDLQMIFGASKDVSGLPASKPERRLQAVMMHAWAVFADNPRAGLKKKLGWPKYHPASKTLIRLGHHNSPVPSFVCPEEYDAPCKHIH